VLLRCFLRGNYLVLEYTCTYTCTYSRIAIPEIKSGSASTNKPWDGRSRVRTYTCTRPQKQSGHACTWCCRRITRARPTHTHARASTGCVGHPPSRTESSLHAHNSLWLDCCTVIKFFAVQGRVLSATNAVSRCHGGDQTSDRSLGPQTALTATT
jgi:hypothetical protein